MNKIIEKDGQKYLVIGKKAVPFDEVDKNGKPKIKVESEEITHPDGSKDVKVKVPALEIKGEQKDL